MKRLLAVIAIATLTVPVLAVAVAVPAQAGGGCHSEHARDARGVQVNMAGACFDPMVIRIQPGQRVRWTNQDSMVHNVLGAGRTWGSGADLTEGKSVAERFAKSGVYPYFCAFHPGMVGAVVVGDGTSSDTDIDSTAVTSVQDEAPAPPAAAQPAAAQQGAAESNAGPMIGALIALAAALVLGALVLLARRTPHGDPHPQT